MGISNREVLVTCSWVLEAKCYISAMPQEPLFPMYPRLFGVDVLCVGSEK